MSLLKSILETREEIEHFALVQQQVMEQAKARNLTSAAALGSLGANGLFSNSTQTQKSSKRFDPNTHEAFNVPLEHLVTMWRLKYGDRWYDATEVRGPEEYDFYQGAFMRLKYAKMFESFDGWYRLKEGLA